MVFDIVVKDHVVIFKPTVIQKIKSKMEPDLEDECVFPQKKSHAVLSAPLQQKKHCPVVRMQSCGSCHSTFRAHLRNKNTNV